MGNKIAEEINMAINSISDSTIVSNNVMPKNVINDNKPLFLKESENAEKKVNFEKGVVSKILNFLDELFDGNSKGKRSGIEISIKNDGLNYYAERPHTPEFIAHDEYMNNKIAEWIKNNPEPKFNPYAFCINSEYFEWTQEMQKYMNILETTYREENPEYKAQALDYEDAQKQANLMM